MKIDARIAQNTSRLLKAESDVVRLREKRRLLMAEGHENGLTHNDLMKLTGLGRAMVGAELARGKSDRKNLTAEREAATISK